MTEDKDTILLIVNGREKTVPSKELSPDGELSFDQVVRIAFDPPPSGPNIVITVTYRNGAGRPPEGRLKVGESVKVQDGTIFNVTPTDKS